MTWKNNFLTGLILLLFGIIIFQTCRIIKSVPQVHVDTTISITNTYVDSTIITKPVIRESVPYEFNTSTVEYLPDTALIRMVKELKQMLSQKNIYRDTVRVDTFGTATIDETIENNKIAQRKIKYDLIIPTKTVSIVKEIPQKIKNQWFIGGGIGGNAVGIDINAGLGLQNKKGQLYELKGRTDFKGNLTIELNTFWKIH